MLAPIATTPKSFVAPFNPGLPMREFYPSAPWNATAGGGSNGGKSRNGTPASRGGRITAARPYLVDVTERPAVIARDHRRRRHAGQAFGAASQGACPTIRVEALVNKPGQAILALYEAASRRDAPKRHRGIPPFYGGRPVQAESFSSFVAVPFRSDCSVGLQLRHSAGWRNHLLSVPRKAGVTSCCLRSRATPTIEQANPSTRTVSSSPPRAGPVA